MIPRSILILCALTLAALRFHGEKSAAFQAVAHMFVAFLFTRWSIADLDWYASICAYGYAAKTRLSRFWEWLVDRNWFYGWLALALTVAEIVAFVGGF